MVGLGILQEALCRHGPSSAEPMISGFAIGASSAHSTSLIDASTVMLASPNPTRRPLTGAASR